MRLRFLPIAQLFLAVAIMIVIDTLFPQVRLEGSWSLPLSAMLFLLGVMLVVMGGKEFRRFKTTVNPVNPENATRLVTTGIYRYSRNPMYLGFALILIGFGVFLKNILSLLVVVVFIWFNTMYQILPEEKALERKFGESFRKYRARVRRWI